MSAVQRGAWAAMSAAAIVIIFGCGGGSGGSGSNSSGGSTSGGIGGTSARAKALQAISSYFQGLPHQDLTSDNSALAAYLKTRSDIKTEGVSNDGTVWANFTDGSGLLVATNREVEPSMRGSVVVTKPVRAKSSPTPLQGNGQTQPNLQTRAPIATWSLPTAKRVYLYDAFGESSSPFADDPRVVALKTQDWLTNALDGGGYSVIPLDGTIATLKKAQTLDVLYIDADAGTGTNLQGQTFYGLGSSVPVTDENTVALSADIAAGRVGYLLAPSLVDPPSFAKGYRLAAQYYITASFVQQYMSFTPQSLVVINATSSHLDSNFVGAFYSKGASTFVGWNGVVSSYDAAESAEYLFDRLLGSSTDTAYLPSPPQRAFTIDDVLGNDMFLHNRTGKSYSLASSSSWGQYSSQVQYYVNPGLNTTLNDACGILAPTISSWTFIPGGTQSDPGGKDILSVNGVFGADPGAYAHSLTINGTPLDTSITWNNGTVAVNLPDNGPGSSGDVVATYNGARSNAVQLSSWQGPVTTTFPGQGAQVSSASWKLHMRGVLNTIRLSPESAPQLGWSGSQYQLVIDKDSSATWTCSGSYTTGTTTTTWTPQGSQTMQFFQSVPSSPPSGVMTANAEVAQTYPQQPTFYFSFDEGSANGAGILETTVDSQSGKTSTYLQGFGSRGYLNVPAVAMGSTYRIFTNTWTPISGVVTLNWPAISATNPPNPNGAQ